MSRKTTYSAEFKSKVVLDVLQGNKGINPSCLPPHLLLQDGQERNESQDLAVHYGALGHQRYPQHLLPRRI